MDSYCLVLGGGGAKGVYHIGVWRALRELGIEVNAFIGTSIGAIIAGFLAQGADDKLEELGRSITVDDILALPPELTQGGEVKLDLESLTGIRELFHKAMNRKGLDTGPLKRLLVESLDEASIRAGGKDLGIVTVNVSALEPREVFIEDMEPGSLVEYLLASAAFPGFEQPRIGGQKYIDGGLYDNVPYAMARRRGYRRVIVSDLSGAGLNRRPQIEGGLTVYIKNSIDFGGVLDFNRAFLDSFMELGYLDALRAFGRLEGYSYFLEPDPEAEAAFAREGAGARDAGARGAEARDAPGIPWPERMRHDRRGLLKRLECAASALEVERIRAYSYAGLEAAIRERAAAVDAKVAAARAGGRLMQLAAPIREAVAARRFEDCPLYYYRLVEEAVPGAAGSLLKKALEGLFPELPAAVAWLDGAAGA
ncbi:MAG TPA: patatin-like phospholipase family protein [Spirochaetales bacterium]|nr:patatin-like phospholipase family protein [Spirochaetales bacterium]HRY53056.1 patatin-like phospholipase family protein [Spirochaetia bacterium]